MKWIRPAGFVRMLASMIGVATLLSFGTALAVVGNNDQPAASLPLSSNESSRPQRQAVPSDTDELFCADRASSGADVPIGSGTYMTANGSLFRLGQSLTCMRKLHPARVN